MQILIEIDEGLAQRLERVAPARSRKRSDFVRTAIQKAIWELEERATAEAYAGYPDSGEDAYLDATAWEPRQNAKRSRRRRK